MVNLWYIGRFSAKEAEHQGRPPFKVMGQKSRKLSEPDVAKNRSAPPQAPRYQKKALQEIWIGRKSFETVANACGFALTNARRAIPDDSKTK